MREAPPSTSDAAVLDAVRRGWLPGAGGAEHLPVGFGAHHWRVDADGSPSLFATLDSLGSWHTARSLEAAYTATAELAARGLDFVHPPLASHGGRFVEPLGDGLLSVTSWLEGTSGDGVLREEGVARTTAAMLGRLHDVLPPGALPRWRPLVGSDLGDRLADRTSAAWDAGPHGETARHAIRGRLDAISRWAHDYHALTARSDPAGWVVTHGEPHTRNQVTDRHGRTVLVDWESIRLAPPERDLRVLVEDGWGHLCDADPAHLRLFDLEWRLDEIAQYADWFQAPHVGGADDEVALGGLRHELERPPSS